MNMAAEDFTFPVITTTNAAVNLALLPPLWRISDDADSYKATTTAAARQRRTLASQIFEIDGEGARVEEEEEGSQEKMDLLWEDFNEELRSSAASSDSDCSGEIIRHRNSDDDEIGNLEVYANVRQLKLIPEKAKKLESLVKVMKKLFLQNSNATARSNINGRPTD